MESNIKSYIISNKSLFEEVQASHARSSSVDQFGRYSVLDYEKIMNSIIEYLDGYIKYKNDDDDRYRGKINASTEAFYNKMFVDDMYRHEISLEEFKNSNRAFVELTKTLQDKMQELENCVDCEAKGLYIITDRQYRKVGKVMHDDMQIYMWKTVGKTIDTRIKVTYNDKTTPVMHFVK